MSSGHLRSRLLARSRGPPRGPPEPHEGPATADRGRIVTGRPRLTVLGTGYLGITQAACMASEGFEVLGLDTDAVKVARLQAGEVPIYEPGLDRLVTEGLSSGRLSFTTSYEQAAEFGDVHFLCVGTPQQ